MIIKHIDYKTQVVTGERVLPIERRYGVGIERVSHRLLFQASGAEGFMRSMGFRYVEDDIVTNSRVYVRWPWGFLWYKAVLFFRPMYWWCLRWFYRTGLKLRLFEEIPPAKCFSWRYFRLFK